MNGTTLSQLGWSITEKRTDPRTRDTTVEVWVNRGSTVFKLKNPDEDGEVIQMEDAAQVRR